MTTEDRVLLLPIGSYESAQERYQEDDGWIDERTTFSFVGGIDSDHLCLRPGITVRVDLKMLPDGEYEIIDHLLVDKLYVFNAEDADLRSISIPCHRFVDIRTDDVVSLRPKRSRHFDRNPMLFQLKRSYIPKDYLQM